MTNSKLIDLLKKLPTRERTKFKEYVASPFFNKNKKVRSLCAHVLKYSPDFEHANLKKVKAFTVVFGKKTAYNELKINNVISDTLQLLYDFLAYQQYQERPLLEKEFLIKELLEREIHHHIERNTWRYEQLKKKSPLRNHEYFQQEYRLYEQLDLYSLTKEKKDFDQNLQKKSDHLDLYYWSNKLRIACEMVERNMIVQGDYRCHFLEDILKVYEADFQNIQAVPALSIYYKILQMLQYPEQESYYFELKQLLQEHYLLFPQQELRSLYNYALNYSTKKINFGQSQYYQEILDLYKILLDQQIIFKNGYLTQWTYINIITAGIRLQEYEWTEHFIHHYKAYLLPEEQHNAFTYNLAAFYYAKGDLSAALQLLQDVAFTFSFYHIAAKIIQLKSYYDLDEMEAFFALVEAFKKYLQRHKQLSDYHRKSNQNFLKIATKVYDLRLKKGIIQQRDFRGRHQKLSKQLSDIEPIANKRWLVECLECLIK